jgi:hypothetical protein
MNPRDRIVTTMLDDLRVMGGECSCHIFENESSGIPRGAFWSFDIDFEEVVFDEQPWLTSLQVEWLSWPIRDWRNLDHCTLANVQRPDLIESTIYLAGRHQEFRLDDVSLRHLGSAEFELGLVGTFAVADLKGRTHGPSRKSFEARTRFTGAIVVPDNLFPKPNLAAAATTELNAFLNVATFEAPVWDRFRFVFPPRGAA